MPDDSSTQAAVLLARQVKIGITQLKQIEYDWYLNLYSMAQPDVASLSVKCPKVSSY